MTGRSRIRRTLKWMGTTLCVLVIGVWVTSLFVYAHRYWPEVRLRLGAGRLEVKYCHFEGEAAVVAYAKCCNSEAHRPGWNCSRVLLSCPVNRKDRFGFVLPCADYTTTTTTWRSTLSTLRIYQAYVVLPVWLPLLLIAIPTMLLWRRDRRIRPGHCQKCGYDLTGNESGRCPECGDEVAGNARNHGTD